jgi:polyhydroxybutyrate depolymerase
VPSEPRKRELPLILNFHGANANDTFQATYSQLEEKGPARGFVVMTPNAGTPSHWDSRETDPNARFFEPSDANMAFTDALLNTAAGQLCIDKHRVYAAGYSNGAGMAAYLGCQSKLRLAAIATVAGVNLAEPCPRGRPLSSIVFHGTADNYGGGPVVRPPRVDTVLPSVEAAVDAWAQRAKCRTKPSRQPIGTEVERIAYRDCARGTNVVLYAVMGGGHTWPGSFDVPQLGHPTQDINAANLILDFFSHHPPSAKKVKS